MQMLRVMRVVVAIGITAAGLTFSARPAHTGVPDIVPGPANPHFSFLPPIAPVPEPRAAFDASLLPYLSVEICELTGPHCVAGPLVARFTSSSGPGSGRLRVSRHEGHYLADWHTRGSSVSAGQRYRISVLAARTELGNVDLDVVERNRKGARDRGDRSAHRPGFVIVHGQTVPIKFRVERGAISVVGREGGTARVETTGGTATTADGGVTLLFRPEAVTVAADITITRPATFPAGPGVLVPRSVFEFGPTGMAFNRPVQITIRYDAADVPENAPVGDLRLHKVIDGAWREVPGSLVDPATNTVTGFIDGFSVYGVMTRVGVKPGPTISGVGTAVVDGTMSPGEWDFAGRLDFLASLPDGTDTSAALYVMNDATMLYLAVRFDRTLQGSGNNLEITFDGNDDGVTVSGDDNLRFVVGANPEFNDEHWTTTCPAGLTFCARLDTAASGTSDGQGAFTHHGTFSVYEIAHPLKSGDSAHDLVVGPGQRVGFRLALRMSDANHNVSETLVPGPHTYGHILIQPAALPLLAGLGTATLDGMMNTGEWADAACAAVPINVPGGHTTPGRFCVMNDQSNLYVALQFKRGSGDIGSTFAVEFDNNDDGVAENGDDVILYNPAVGFFDEFRTNLPPCPSSEPATCALPDTDHAGTDDGAGAFTNDGTYSTYEMSHSLNSGDAGHDFALAAGDRVGFFFFARMIQPPGAFPADFGDTNFPGFRNYGHICVRAPGGDGSECALASKFLNGHPCATAILKGTPYDMNDPGWLAQGTQNPDVCAYKFFSAFHMLGYNTETGYTIGADDPHLRILHAFQARYGLPVGDLVTLDVLLQLDELLAAREAKIAEVAKTFPLYDHMQPLHPNQVSKDWVAYMYMLPMRALPPYLQMSLYETVQCIKDQCNGFIQDAHGNPWPVFPVNLAQDYRFVGAYFDPRRPNVRLPSATVHVDTVLHEYAHYLDVWSTIANQPHAGMITTSGFNDISYDMSSAVQGCALRRTNDPEDWISWYGFTASYGCPPGRYRYWEEFAEAFAMYVTAGKHFRAAAQQNATIARKYNWLKTNVFQGIEYDTDLQREVGVSGCNDVPGYQQAEPGYASCSESYVWNAELRLK